MVKTERANKKKPNRKQRTRKLRDTSPIGDINEICKENTQVMTIPPSWEKEYEKTFRYSLQKTNDKYQNTLIRMFKIPFSPTNINARSDYYTYINYKWIQEQNDYLKKEKKYYVQVDNFRIAQDNVYRDLISIAEEFIKEAPTNKVAKQLSNVYYSFKRLEPRAVKENVRAIMTKVDEYIQGNDLIAFLAYINLNEVVSWGCPLVWGIQADEKNSSIYSIYLIPGQLSLYDYNLYFEDPELQTTYSKMVRSKFMKYVEDIFDVCLGKNHGLNPRHVFEVEKDLLDAMDCTKLKVDMEIYYNLVSAHDAKAKYGFDWASFSKHVGYTEVPDKIVVTNLNHLFCTMELLKANWTTPKWRTYWLFLYYRQLIRFHKDWREIHFHFNEELLSGQSVIFPRELFPVFGVSACFNTLITNEYVHKNNKPHYVKYMRNMAEDMKLVFTRIIKRNTWLSPKTKKYALLKLKHMKLIIGTPEKMREDPLLDYVEDDPWRNLELLSIWRAKECTKLHGKPVIDIPLIDWKVFKLVGYQSYIVNAFYTPTQNSIYIPSAYLQKPFIDLDERGIEYNLAHVGFTLGHEMSHSLDDLGSQYDYKGNLKNWWTPEDRKEFNKKVKDVIEQYEEAAARDGIKLDASLSTGESLADISGLAICHEYLRDFQDNNQDIVPIRSLSFQAFYCYYAVQAKQQISKRAIKAQTITNPHPLDKYRTNCTLSRLELFKSIHNVQKGDAMYWRNSDTIW
jgi:putative endopeptidase